MNTGRGADRMLDWAMASSRTHLSQKSLARLRVGARQAPGFGLMADY